MSHPSLDVFFTEQKCLILMKSVCPVFSLMNNAFGVTSKNSLFHFKSQLFSPVFPCRSFTFFLCFTFRSIIHFINF